MKNLIEMLTSADASQAQKDLIKELLAKDLASDNSYILSRIVDLLAGTDAKPEPKAKVAPKAKKKKKASANKLPDTRRNMILKVLSKAKKPMPVSDILVKLKLDGIETELKAFHGTIISMEKRADVERKDIGGVWHYRAK